MYMHARACTLCKIINVLTRVRMRIRSISAAFGGEGGGRCPPKRIIGGVVALPVPPPLIVHTLSQQAHFPPPSHFSRACIVVYIMTRSMLTSRMMISYYIITIFVRFCLHTCYV